MPDIETLRSLLARVEAADGADRELDDDIVSALGYAVEWKQANYSMELYPVVHWDGTKEPCPALTASIDAVVALIERVLPSGWTRVDVWNTDDVKQVTASVLPLPAPNSTSSGKAATPPLALLAALLKALIAKEEGRG